MKSLLLLLTFLLAAIDPGSCQTTDTLHFRSIPPKEFRNSMEMTESAILIDVREFFEYRKSRIDHAVNIPSSGDIDRSADTINREAQLYLYCTTGFRSKRVAKQLTERGFSNVCSLDGGINAWKKEGLPVNKKKIKKVK